MDAPTPEQIKDILSRAISVIRESEGADEHGSLVTELQVLEAQCVSDAEIRRDIREWLWSDEKNDYREIDSCADFLAGVTGIMAMELK
jgi:hypothetical protein